MRLFISQFDDYEQFLQFISYLKAFSHRVSRNEDKIHVIFYERIAFFIFSLLFIYITLKKRKEHLKHPHVPHRAAWLFECADCAIWGINRAPNIALSWPLKKKSCKIAIFDYTFMLIYNIKCVKEIVTQLLRYCYNITPASVCQCRWETGDTNEKETGWNVD